MDSLHFDFAVRRRSFTVELALELGEGPFALVGPSGAGKTTVLRALAGLLRPDAGTIALDGKVWFDSERKVDLSPERRSVGLVFQDYALFPHMTVAENVAYSGKARAAELLEAFGISALADERPLNLSGGERQRVALARALARDPDVLLLDEPLSALDAHTHARVRAELREILERLSLPTLVVTHDFEDAAALTERVGVIVDGKLVQTGTAAELLAEPLTPFVAEFTGGNLVPGDARLTSDGLTEVVLADGARLFSTDAGEGRVGLVVYPWEIAVGRTAPLDSTQNHVQGPIMSLIPVGNRVRVRVGPLTAEITGASAERLGLRTGDVVVASFKASGTRLVPLA